MDEATLRRVRDTEIDATIKNLNETITLHDKLISALMDRINENEEKIRELEQDTRGIKSREAY